MACKNFCIIIFCFVVGSFSKGKLNNQQVCDIGFKLFQKHQKTKNEIQKQNKTFQDEINTQH